MNSLLQRRSKVQVCHEKFGPQFLKSIAGGYKIGKKVASGALALLLVLCSSVGAINSNDLSTTPIPPSTEIETTENSKTNAKNKNWIKRHPYLTGGLTSGGALAIVGLLYHNRDKIFKRDLQTWLNKTIDNQQWDAKFKCINRDELSVLEVAIELCDEEAVYKILSNKDSNQGILYDLQKENELGGNLILRTIDKIGEYSNKVAQAEASDDQGIIHQDRELMYSSINIFEELARHNAKISYKQGNIYDYIRKYNAIPTITQADMLLNFARNGYRINCISNYIGPLMQRARECQDFNSLIKALITAQTGLFPWGIKNNYSILEYAIFYCGNQEIVNVIISNSTRGEINYQGYRNRTYLMDLADSTKEVPSPVNKLTAIESFLKHGANVNLTDDDGNSALSIAAENGEIEIVQELASAKGVKKQTKSHALEKFKKWRKNHPYNPPYNTVDDAKSKEIERILS